MIICFVYRSYAHIFVSSTSIVKRYRGFMFFTQLFDTLIYLLIMRWKKNKQVILIKFILREIVVCYYFLKVKKIKIEFK